MKHSLADIGLAAKHFGYQPKVDFEEGLARTVAWYRNRELEPQLGRENSQRLALSVQTGHEIRVNGRDESEPAEATADARDHRRSAELPFVPDAAKISCKWVRRELPSAPWALPAMARSSRPTGRKLVSIEVHLPRLADAWDGFRIAQLSDLHYDEYFSVVPLRKAVDIVNGLQPDLMVVTGDFVTSRGRRHRPENAIHGSEGDRAVRAVVGADACPSGILAALGNHDVDGDPTHIIDVLQVTQHLGVAQPLCSS